VTTELIDAAGDGAGNLLDNPFGLTVSPTGNVYVTGFFSSNAFEILPVKRVPVLGRVGLVILGSSLLGMLAWLHHRESSIRS